MKMNLGLESASGHYLSSESLRGKDHRYLLTLVMNEGEARNLGEGGKMEWLLVLSFFLIHPH